MAESVVGLYKNECVKIDAPFRTIDGLELATLSWVHRFNENRLHSSIDYRTSHEAEQGYYVHKPAPTADAVGRTHPPLEPGRFTWGPGLPAYSGG
jgi:putative transposase